jgi:hypothetical protein
LAGCRGTVRQPSRGASSSVWRWPGSWRKTLPRFWPTSRRAASTRRRARQWRNLLFARRTAPGVPHNPALAARGPDDGTGWRSTGPHCPASGLSRVTSYPRGRDLRNQGVLEGRPDAPSGPVARAARGHRPRCGGSSVRPRRAGPPRAAGADAAESGSTGLLRRLEGGGRRWRLGSAPAGRRRAAGAAPGGPSRGVPRHCGDGAPAAW